MGNVTEMADAEKQIKRNPVCADLDIVIFHD